MEIWDMMINITRARADKAFRELDYEVFTAEILSGEGLQKLKKEPETAVQEENKDEQKQ